MPNTPAENEYMKEWRKRNAEKMRAYHREYYLAHREKKLAYSKAWAAANPQRALANQQTRTRRWKVKKLGVTLEYYDEMLDAQEGCCAVCDEPFTETPNIDHDHATGRVRGLLCEKCNFGIGFLRDSAEIAANASGYLEGWAS